MANNKITDMRKLYWRPEKCVPLQLLGYVIGAFCLVAIWIYVAMGVVR